MNYNRCDKIACDNKMRKRVLKVVIPSLQEISMIVNYLIDISRKTDSSISLPSIISLEEFSAYLHFELLRSAVFKKMSTKPFRSFLIEYGMLSDEKDDSAYRSFCARLLTFRVEKTKDYKDAVADRLPDFNKDDGLKSKRDGLSMNLAHFAQFQILQDMNVEKGQSAYRFHDYKNYKNRDIVDYYAEYDRDLYKNIINNETFSDDKSLWAAKAISLDMLEHERGSEFLYRLAAVFSEQSNKTYEELYQIYSPFIELLIGNDNISFPISQGQKRVITVSRHPILFLDRYLTAIPGWDKMQRDKEINKLEVMGCISTMILGWCGKEDLDQSEDELIGELYQTIKTEYPIFNAYGISQRTSSFIREWRGKTLTYYRKLVGEIFMPRRDKRTSKG